jgi:hypothetical protein
VLQLVKVVTTTQSRLRRSRKIKKTKKAKSLRMISRAKKSQGQVLAQVQALHLRHRAVQAVNLNKTRINSKLWVDSTTSNCVTASRSTSIKMVGHAQILKAKNQTLKMLADYGSFKMVSSHFKTLDNSILTNRVRLVLILRERVITQRTFVANGISKKDFLLLKTIDSFLSIKQVDVAPIYWEKVLTLRMLAESGFSKNTLSLKRTDQ